VLSTDAFVKHDTTTSLSPYDPTAHVKSTGKLFANSNQPDHATGGTHPAGSCTIFRGDPDGSGTDISFTIDGAIQKSDSDALTNDQLLTQIRKRIVKICFNNTTELNSTIYFCRVNHNDFNYSSNPTYLDSSKIRVKNTESDAPVSYVTSVGLYSSDNELLAVAKVSEPLRKDPTNDMTLRVRLDY